MAPVRHLRRIQDTQLEYTLLRYCLRTKPVRPTRMLKPDTVAPALQHYEEMAKGELERVVADAGQTLKLSSKKWIRAKLLVREGGLGLQDIPFISLAAWVATMGAAAHMATEMTTLAPGCTAPGLVRGWFTDNNDGFEQELARLATKSQPRGCSTTFMSLTPGSGHYALTACPCGQDLCSKSKTLLND